MIFKINVLRKRWFDSVLNLKRIGFSGKTGSQSTDTLANRYTFLMWVTFYMYTVAYKVVY